MANIYNKFRQELGYTNVSNQYIELSSRKLQAQYGSALQTGIADIARQEGLSISNLDQDFGLRIAQGYIVSVYACLDRFLADYKNLPGSPTYREKEGDLSLLEWTWKIVGKKAAQDEKDAFYLCDYYRLVRNNIVHKGASGSQLKQRYSCVKKLRSSRLKAPNSISELTFDDQVLFSRAAFSLAKFIFTKGEYDIDEAVESHKAELYPQVRAFLGTDNPKPAARKIKKALEAYYPPFENVDWDAVLYIVENVRGTGE